MAQEKVTRKELEDMHIGQTRIFTLSDPKKLAAAATTCNQMKNERRGAWTIKRDYQACSISITRLQ